MAIPEAITHEHDGILIHHRDPKAIIDNVTKLLQDNDYSKRLAKNARKTVVEKYSWGKIGKETENVYEKIVG